MVNAPPKNQNTTGTGAGRFMRNPRSCMRVADVIVPTLTSPAVDSQAPALEEELFHEQKR